MGLPTYKLQLVFNCIFILWVISMLKRYWCEICCKIWVGHSVILSESRGFGFGWPCSNWKDNNKALRISTQMYTFEVYICGQYLVNICQLKQKKKLNLDKLGSNCPLGKKLRPHHCRPSCGECKSGCTSKSQYPSYCKRK